MLHQVAGLEKANLAVERGESSALNVAPSTSLEDRRATVATLVSGRSMYRRATSSTSPSLISTWRTQVWMDNVQPNVPSVSRVTCVNRRIYFSAHANLHDLPVCPMFAYLRIRKDISFAEICGQMPVTFGGCAGVVVNCRYYPSGDKCIWTN